MNTNDVLNERRKSNETLAELLRLSDGIVTDDVRALYREKIGKDLKGPTVAAARRILGLDPPVKGTPRSSKEVDPPVPSEMREALNMMAAVEKLQQRQRAIEVEIEAKERDLAAVKAEIEIYKPALGHLRALASAVQGVRTKIQSGGGK